jgi:hypothetical protein
MVTGSVGFPAGNGALPLVVCIRVRAMRFGEQGDAR